MSESISIALAEGPHLDREGLVRLLEDFKDLRIVVTAPNGTELLEALKNCRADIVVMDLDLKIMDVRETFARIRQQYPDTRIVILTAQFEDELVAEFMNMGASAFLSKNNNIRKVVETLRKVHEKGVCADHIVAGILLRHSGRKVTENVPRRNSSALTKREIEIIRLMCMGKESAAIARHLQISASTVDGHRHNIWNKTSCNNIIELLEYAFRHDLIAF